MTFSEVQEFLVELIGIYPSFKIMDGTVKAWADRLPDMSLDKARKLLNKWLEDPEGNYAPKLDYFVKGMKATKTTAFYCNVPILYHVGTGRFSGCLFDQEGREYGDPDAPGPYRAGAGDYEIFNSNGERIQWMDERGYIHNRRGVFFKVRKEGANNGGV